MSFARPERPVRHGSLPLVPMIDLMFILIIFFVTTTVFREEERQIDVNLAATETGVAGEPTRTEIVINIRADGAVMLGYSEVEPPALYEKLRQIVEKYPNERVIIRGDQAAVYGRVLAVTDAVRAAGVRNISFATVKKAEEAGGG